jgi:hypothetical protein
MNNDTPAIDERYITARNGSEVLTAASLSAIGEEREQVAVALLLWEVTYQGRSEQQKHLAELLGARLNRQMGKSKRLKGDAWKIAQEILAWHLHGICTKCDGRGYEQIKDTPSLSNNICNECHGTGKRPYPREASHIWMVAYIGSLTAIASGEIMRRLARDMSI